MIEPLMRIGEISRAANVSADVLRAWERRYGLLQPQRSHGGYRLYSSADLERVRLMHRLVESGVPASEAARRVLGPGAPTRGTTPEEPHTISPIEDLRQELRGLLRAFDDAGAQATIDQLFAAFDIETVITEVFLPELRALGDEWEQGVTSVGHEHFAVQLIRARLMALGRAWGQGMGPRVVLACPPGDHHDISLAMFGLVAHQRGWRITFLGADTPIDTLLETATATSADCIVLYSPMQLFLADAADVLAGANGGPSIYFAGAGATLPDAERAHATLLEGPLGGAVTRITRDFQERDGLGRKR